MTAEAQRPPAEGDEVARLRHALKFYADGDHFARHQPEAWDTVSGEPSNFYEDEAATATVEDGSVAKAALDGVGLQDEKGLPVAAAFDALRELVACKDLKERAEALHFAGPLSKLGEGWKAEYDRLRAEYIRRQPAAWEVARDLLKSPSARPNVQPKGTAASYRPLKTSAEGRAAVERFFVERLGRHDFNDYIRTALAADFACVLGGYLQAPAPGAQPKEVQDAAWRKWDDSGTVGSLIAFLATLDQAEPIVTAYHITLGSGERRCKTRRLTISKERVDHTTSTIRTADTSLPYTHVLWAHPPEAAPSPAVKDRTMNTDNTINSAFLKLQQIIGEAGSIKGYWPGDSGRAERVVKLANEVIDLLMLPSSGEITHAEYIAQVNPGALSAPQAGFVPPENHPPVQPTGDA